MLKSKTELPDTTKEPIIHVDASPDAQYPLRILRAHRANCDVLWTDNTEGKKPVGALCELMNEHNRQRAKILDQAIADLEAAMAERGE